MKTVGGMKVAASRLARGMVSSANPGIYSKTYPEGSYPEGSDPFGFDPFGLIACSSIYSKAYTEGSDPFDHCQFLKHTHKKEDS